MWNRTAGCSNTAFSKKKKCMSTDSSFATNLYKVYHIKLKNVAIWVMECYIETMATAQ